MHVAVVDIGSNSTRLLIADVLDGRVAAELDRRTTVTRLGEGVDATGRLGEAPMERVFTTLAEYRAAIDELGVTTTTAVLTSAVRDAANGAEFTRTVAERYGLHARTLSGDEEARLMYLGTTSDRADGGRVAVIDIGGGSTEIVIGAGRKVDYHVSAQAGVVRQTERFLLDDPPEHEQLEQLAEEVRAIFAAALPEDVRRPPLAGIAVAGTATSAAATAQELDPYDPERVHGYPLSLGTCERLLAQLAGMPLERRREVTGLHPDRAPTIVAGLVILIEAMRLLGLELVEISEHDILHGAAIARASEPG